MSPVRAIQFTLAFPFFVVGMILVAISSLILIGQNDVSWFEPYKEPIP